MRGILTAAAPGGADAANDPLPDLPQFIEVINCQLFVCSAGDLNELLVVHIPDSHGINVNSFASQVFSGLSHLVLGPAVREDQQHLRGACLYPAAHVWPEVVPHLPEGSADVCVPKDLLDAFDLK